MPKPKWDIRNQGRPWSKDEAWERFELLPEKNELIFGQLTWSKKERENVLGLLLELVGADKLCSSVRLKCGAPRLPSCRTDRSTGGVHGSRAFGLRRAAPQACTG